MQRMAIELGANLNERGVSVIPQTPPGQGWLGRFVGLPAIAATKRADIYHVVDHSLGHAAALLPARRTVVSVHDLYLLRQAAAGTSVPRRHLAQFRLSTSFVGRVGGIVAQTEATKADIVEFLDIDPSRIDVVRLGVNTGFQPVEPSDVERLRAKWEMTGPTIVQVGNSPYKNLDAVVRTLARVRQSGIHATLFHVGEPIDGAAASLGERLGVHQHIRQLGRLPDDQLIEIFNAGDVLLFPSLWEGMGWPPLEAMACGLPVVASDIPAIAEVTAGAALLAEPTDIEGLAKEVSRVLTDPGLIATQRELGFRQAAEYNWASTTDGYLKIYERLINANAAG